MPFFWYINNLCPICFELLIYDYAQIYTTTRTETNGVYIWGIDYLVVLRMTLFCNSP